MKNLPARCGIDKSDVSKLIVAQMTTGNRIFPMNLIAQTLT